LIPGELRPPVAESRRLYVQARTLFADGLQNKVSVWMSFIGM